MSFKLQSRVFGDPLRKEVGTMNERAKISRRELLKSSVAFGLGVSLLGGARTLSAAPKKAGDKVWKIKYDCF